MARESWVYSKHCSLYGTVAGGKLMGGAAGLRKDLRSCYGLWGSGG